MNIPAAVRRDALEFTQAPDGSLTVTGNVPTATGGESLAFTFGDPEPVLKSQIAEYLGVFIDMQYGYYIPPISLIGLANLEHANAHHGPILRFKRNMVCKWFKPSPMLGMIEMRKAALDYQVFGNAYFQVIRNRLGGVLRLERRPALMMRVGVEPGSFFEVQDWRFRPWQPIQYRPGEIIHIQEDDVKQTIYGIPEYFGGIQSVLLSEAAILFRRKYYENGAHMGYILVTNANLDAETAKTIEEAVKQSKGPGNWRNLYVNVSSNGREIKEPVKVIPVGDIATRDDIAAVNGITRSACLAMHRMQPGISGVIPENMTGFGDLEKVMRVYIELEVPPMQQPFLILNDILPPAGRIGFDAPQWQAA